VFPVDGAALAFGLGRGCRVWCGSWISHSFYWVLGVWNWKLGEANFDGFGAIHRKWLEIRPLEPSLW
jgi:hypothetical protein